VASTPLKVRGTYGERGNNGGLGAEPQRDPGAVPLFRRSGGEAPPPEAESFTTFGRPTEAITFMSFAIFCKLGIRLISATQYPDKT